MMKALITTAVLLCGIRFAQAEEIGTVNTAFKLLGSDKIVVEVFDDPEITGVSCYVSRAKTGGLTGAIGFAEDKADSSVACRQVGDITFKESVPKQRDVFTERASFFFKRVHVVRMVDQKRRVLVYLVYSDKLIDGSPKNSVTAVPLSTAVKLLVTE